MNEERDPSIDDRDLWVFVICTVRYSLGRRSYMPSLCSDLVKKYASALDPRHLMQIADEIDAELELYAYVDQAEKAVGAKRVPPDIEESWRELAGWLRHNR